MDNVIFRCFDTVPPGEALYVGNIGRGKGRLSFRLTGTDRAIRWAEAVIGAGTAVIAVEGLEYLATLQSSSRSEDNTGHMVWSDMLVALTPLSH